MARKRKQGTTEVAVDPEQVAHALAKAVFDGDFVNFRFLFSPFSPGRATAAESFEAERYAYLLPEGDMEQTEPFRRALSLIQDGAVWSHIQQELNADRPAQLPWAPVMRLADRAVELGKFSNAAYAYEMLRIRARMQDRFLEQADRSLDAGELEEAVRGYLVASGLEYDYSAFPEPLPKIPSFQTRALMLHGEYPKTPEDSLPLQPAPAFLRTAFGYLLDNPEMAARIEDRPIDGQVAFLKELIVRQDPKWDAFAERFKDACSAMQAFSERLERAESDSSDARGSLADEIADQLGEDPHEIMVTLVGHAIEEGEWWQYLKELAYRHPAAILFISRQIIGDVETLVPRYRDDSPVPGALGLIPARTGTGA
ncbi:MAG: hypothetical protein GY851_30750 [bacterium]|nr:hypothetical protein [bacterium]